jgi:hypothetical protein
MTVAASETSGCGLIAQINECGKKNAGRWRAGGTFSEGMELHFFCATASSLLCE